jgi:predicted  nucleic acid-binding Zn-ribbon protein
MASTSIEKENLEAHVELCAERYRNLNEKLESLDSRMTKIEALMVEIKQSVERAPNESNKTIIAIGTTIVGAMIGAVITLVVHLK